MSGDSPYSDAEEQLIDTLEELGSEHRQAELGLDRDAVSEEVEVHTKDYCEVSLKVKRGSATRDDETAKGKVARTTLEQVARELPLLRETLFVQLDETREFNPEREEDED